MASYFNAEYYFAAKAKQLSTTEKTWTAADVQAEFANLGIKAEDHYKAYGASEGLSPNAYFNEKEYLASKLAALQDNDPTWANKTVADLQAEFKALGINAADHYEQYGAFETRKDGTLLNPSNAFDANAYFAAKLAQLQKINFEGADTMTVADVVKAVQEAGISPVAHLQAYGATEAKTDGIPLVQTVPVAQRVPNDPIRAEFGELVPSNFNPPSKAPAAAVAAPVTKPADVGGLSATKPVVPTAPVKVPGDAGYIAPPANLVDTNEKPVLPPTTTEGTGPNAGFIIVDKETGKGTVVKPDGTIQGEVVVEVKPDGTVTPPAPNAPVEDKDGNNTNDKPADNTGKPVDPTPPTVDPEPEPDVPAVPTPVLKVTYGGGTEDAPTKAIIEVSNNVATKMTLTKKVVEAKDVYTLTPDGGAAPFELKAGFTGVAYELSKDVTLIAESSLLTGKAVTPFNASTSAGKVEITGFTSAHDFSGLDTALTVKAILDANQAYASGSHATIDEFVVATNKMLTDAKSNDMIGKTITGAGDITLADSVISGSGTIDASGMTGTVTATIQESGGATAHNLTYKGAVGVDTITLKPQTTSGDYSNLKIVADLGAGNDSLTVNIGANGISFADASTLDGGAGTDTLNITGTASGSGVLKFHADNSLKGIEKIDFSGVSGSFDVGLSLYNQSEDFEVKGTGRDDLIYGGSGKDTIYGGSGADWIRGNEGDDTLYASAANNAADTISSTNAWIAKNLGGVRASLSWEATSTADKNDSGSNISDDSTFWITLAARKVLNNANVLEAGTGTDTMHASAGKDVFLFQHGGEKTSHTVENSFDGLTNTINNFDTVNDKLMIMDQDSWNKGASAVAANGDPKDNTYGQRGFSTSWNFEANGKLTIDGAQGKNDNADLTWGTNGTGVKVAKESGSGTTFDYTITIDANILADTTLNSGSDLVIKLVGLADNLFDSAAELNTLFGTETA